MKKMSTGPREALGSAADHLFGVIARRIPKRYRLRRFLRAIHRRMASAPRPNPMTRLIEEFGRGHPDAFFIQVGSNDGVQVDPLRRQVVEGGWSGVMVEPIPYVFERLRRNYGHHPGIRLENVAIADTDGSFTLYYLPETDDDASLPSWYTALASFSKDIILQHGAEIPDIERRVSEIEVPSMTFDTLCAKHGIERVDLIHIDTEGYDFEIIKSIDLQKLSPRMIVFEHYHMAADTYEDCIDYMRSFGFEDLAVGMDTVCLHKGQLGSDRRLVRLWKKARAQKPVPAFRSDVGG